MTLRFVLSLKKSADPEGGQEWQLSHFSTIEFANGPPPGSRDFTTSDGVETVLVDANTRATSLDDGRHANSWMK